MPNNKLTVTVSILTVIFMMTISLIVINAENIDANTDDVNHILIDYNHDEPIKEYPSSVCKWDEKSCTLTISSCKLEYICIILKEVKECTIVLNGDVVVTDVKDKDLIQIGSTDTLDDITIKGTGSISMQYKGDGKMSGLMSGLNVDSKETHVFVDINIDMSSKSH